MKKYNILNDIGTGISIAGLIVLMLSLCFNSDKGDDHGIYVIVVMISISIVLMLVGLVLTKYIVLEGILDALAVIVGAFIYSRIRKLEKRTYKYYRIQQACGDYNATFKRCIGMHELYIEKLHETEVYEEGRK